MKKKNVKIIIDILMIAALPVLMAYSLVGETLHEIVGTGMLVLFITHHILNRKATAAESASSPPPTQRPFSSFSSARCKDRISPPACRQRATASGRSGANPPPE